MYVVGNAVTIVWEIQSLTNKIVSQSLFDIIVIDPAGLATYYTNPTTNWVAPTLTTLGSATFIFTPSSRGKHKILLVTGISSDYTILDTFKITAICKIPLITTCTRVLPTRVTQVRCAPETIVGQFYDGSIDPAYEITQLTDLTQKGTDLYFLGKNTKAGSTIFWGIWKTDEATMSTLTLLSSVTNLPGWNGLRYPEFIEYSPALDLFILQDEQSDAWYSTDDCLTWTKTTDNGFLNNASVVHWNPDLAVFYRGGTATSNSLLVSTDGITWDDQSTSGLYQTLGGSHQNQAFVIKTLSASGQKFHILSQWEEYAWKTVDTGGSTGWTKTANNGVIGGVGSTIPLTHWVTDGTIIMVSGLYYYATTTDPSATNPWTEATGVNLPWWSTNPPRTIINLEYFSEYERPWIITVANSSGLDPANVLWYDSVDPRSDIGWEVCTTPLASINGPVWPKWNTTAGRTNYLNNGKWIMTIDSVGLNTDYFLKKA